MGLLDRIRSGPLVAFDVPVGNFRLHVQATVDLQDETRASALKHWEGVEVYLVRHSAFQTSYVPVPVSDDAPQVIRAMGEAAELTGVGPMVALPGALVEAVATDLALDTKEVIVSAEGDSFVIRDRPCTFVVEPREGPAGGIAIRVTFQEPYAFYSSTGRLRVDPVIGHARAVAVLAERGALADAVGSAMGSAMHRPQDVERALEIARRTPGVRGALLLVEGRIGVWGELEIVTPGAGG